MSMTDPIADLLTRIRNANQARKEQVDAPWSRLKEALVRVMIEEGYLKECSVVEDGKHRALRIWLRYDEKNHPVITGVKRVSRPSLRVYAGSTGVKAIRSGLGINILSTPAGLLVDREARRRNVGGEVLCSVW